MGGRTFGRSLDNLAHKQRCVCRRARNGGVVPRHAWADVGAQSKKCPTLASNGGPPAGSFCFKPLSQSCFNQARKNVLGNMFKQSLTATITVGLGCQNNNHKSKAKSYS